MTWRSGFLCSASHRLCRSGRSVDGAGGREHLFAASDHGPSRNRGDKRGGTKPRSDERAGRRFTDCPRTSQSALGRSRDERHIRGRGASLETEIGPLFRPEIGDCRDEAIATIVEYFPSSRSRRGEEQRERGTRSKSELRATKRVQYTTCGGACRWWQGRSRGAWVGELCAPTRVFQRPSVIRMVYLIKRPRPKVRSDSS